MQPGFGYGGQRMMERGFGYGGGLHFLPILAFLLFAAIVIALLVWAIARKSSRSHTGATPAPGAPATIRPEDTALAIARERLARGEIDPGQYSAIAAALTGQPLVTTP